MRAFLPGWLIAGMMLFSGCASVDTVSSESNVAVHWELVTNFLETPGSFEARFVLKNSSELALADDNWALFFNMAPRPILPDKTPQPAQVKHLNGDWYKLVPIKGFSLAPGDSVAITYWGTEGVIKETDRPLGLYFVFYDATGEEERIVEVSDVSYTPFTSPEQINRSPEDEEPIPTPQWMYAKNEQLTLLPGSEVKKIIPTPVRLWTSAGSFSLSDVNTIFYESGLQNEAQHLATLLSNVTGHDFGVAEDDDLHRPRSIALRTSSLTVAGASREAYHLRITEEGITIIGSDPSGVFYGIQSVGALIPPEAYANKTSDLSLPFVSIEDAPRFGFRALHMDVARNFQSKETILRTLDLMAFYKLNRFLLYTTEDEGWRLEIDGLPELTTVGARRQHTFGMEASVLHPAYGSGPHANGKDNHGTGYYSRADFIEILKYARARHIKVIPELNFPGHARAAIKAMEARYERLMKEGREEEANEYRLIDPDDKSQYLSAQAYKDNVVSVARESTFRFYEKVVNEIAAMYEEAGLVLDEFHAGGDEVPEGAWTASPLAKDLMAKHPEIKDAKNLQSYFFRELLKRLKKRNLQVDAWEEAVLLKNEKGGYDPNPEFAGQNVVPFIWNNLFDYPDLGYRLANAGYPVVLCNVSNFYFDLAYSKDPREPGLYWAGFVDTQDAWRFAPLDMFKTTLETSMGRKIDPEKEYADKERLRPEARKNILGLEAQLWSETIKGRDMLEYYMLPKLMGFAESAWAAPRSWETMENRERREQEMASQWNVFANTLGQRDLPRLSHLNDGYNYRIPPPGAVIRNGVLHANVAFPGLIIRYSTSGEEPHKNSPVYTAPVKVSGRVTVKCFDASGHAGRSVHVTADSNPEH